MHVGEWTYYIETEKHMHAGEGTYYIETEKHSCMFCM